MDLAPPKSERVHLKDKMQLYQLIKILIIEIMINMYMYNQPYIKISITIEGLINNHYIECQLFSLVTKVMEW